MLSLDPEKELEGKKVFALAWLKTGDVRAAAREVFPGAMDGARALLASSEWPNDPFVLEYKQRLRAEFGDAESLPSKFEFARTILEHANATDPALLFAPDEKIKAWKLFADIMGYIDKPGTTISNVIENHVMVVRDFGTDDEWERKGAEQQRKLIESNRAN